MINSKQTSSNSKRNAFADWSEAIAGAIVAAIVFSLPFVVESISEARDLFSDTFIGSKQVASALSFGLLFVGALLSISRRLIESKNDARLTQLEIMARLVDLSERADYTELSEIVKMYSRITNPFFAGVKLDLITQLKFDLSPMASDGMSPPLSAGVYTKEEHAALLAATGSPGRIRAIATLFEGDFDAAPTAEEMEFVEANRSLVESGADFERLFVIDSTNYWDAVTRPSILEHTGPSPHIPGRVVFADMLKQTDPDLYRSVGDGFLMFGDSVAFVDTPSIDRRERGRIVVDSARLGQYHRLYDRLRAYSYEIGTSAHPLTHEPPPSVLSH